MIIARVGSSQCPVVMLEIYMKKAGIAPGSEGFLLYFVESLVESGKHYGQQATSPTLGSRSS